MRLMRKPFKGETFYEWQIGPIVFQVRRFDRVSEHFRRVHIWRDPYWNK